MAFLFSSENLLWCFYHRLTSSSMEVDGITSRTASLLFCGGETAMFTWPWCADCSSSLTSFSMEKLC